MNPDRPHPPVACEPLPQTDRSTYSTAAHRYHRPPHHPAGPIGRLGVLGWRMHVTEWVALAEPATLGDLAPHDLRAGPARGTRAKRRPLLACTTLSVARSHRMAAVSWSTARKRLRVPGMVWRDQRLIVPNSLRKCGTGACEALLGSIAVVSPPRFSALCACCCAPPRPLERLLRFPQGFGPPRCLTGTRIETLSDVRLSLASASTGASAKSPTGTPRPHANETFCCPSLCHSRRRGGRHGMERRPQRGARLMPRPPIADRDPGLMPHAESGGIRTPTPARAGCGTDQTLGGVICGADPDQRVARRGNPRQPQRSGWTTSCPWDCLVPMCGALARCIIAMTCARSAIRIPLQQACDAT